MVSPAFPGLFFCFAGMTLLLFGELPPPFSEEDPTKRGIVIPAVDPCNVSQIAMLTGYVYSVRFTPSMDRRQFP